MLVKLLGTVLLFGWLIWAADFRHVLATLNQIQWTPIALSGGAMIVLQSLSAWRWQRLCIGLDLAIPYATALHHYLVSLFLGLFLPGIVGGDAVRIWQLNRTLNGNRLIMSGFTVLADRANGVFGMVFLAAPAGWSCRDFIPAPWWQGMVLFAVLLALGWSLGPYFLNRFALNPYSLLAKIFPQELTRFWQPAGQWWPAFILSLLYQGSLAGLALILASGLGIALSYSFCMFVVASVALIAVLPISIGGHGIREGIFVLQVGWLGIGLEPAMILGVLFFLVHLPPALMGGLLMLNDARQTRFYPP